MSGLACASGPDSNSAQLRKLIRIGLVAIFLFDAASFLAVHLAAESQRQEIATLRIFNLVLTIAAVLTTSSARFQRDWRRWTFLFYAAPVASATAIALIVHEDDPLQAALFPLLVVSSATVPWESRWQSCPRAERLHSSPTDGSCGVG